MCDHDRQVPVLLGLQRLRRRSATAPPTRDSSPKKIGTSGVWAGVAAGDVSHLCDHAPASRCTAGATTASGRSVTARTTNRLVAEEDRHQRGLGGCRPLATSTPVRSRPASRCTAGATTATDRSVTAPPIQRPSSPKKIGTSGAWARVNAGGGRLTAHTCATTTGNSLYCWGYNDYGQIGDGTTDSRLSPKKIGTSGVWAGATAAASTAARSRPAKSLYCWGYNSNGQVGDGTTDSRGSSPKKIRVTARELGARSGAGHGSSIGGRGSRRAVPSRTAGGYDGLRADRATVPLSSGCRRRDRYAVGPGLVPQRNHSCAVTTGKSLYCLGPRVTGQVGDGTATVAAARAPRKIG